jgi:hypothetical protein
VKNNIQPFRTEWTIHAEDIGVAGTVDFVGKLPDGSFAIIDWKRSQKLPTSMTNNFAQVAL